MKIYATDSREATNLRPDRHLNLTNKSERTGDLRIVPLFQKHLPQAGRRQLDSLERKWEVC